MNVIEPPDTPPDPNGEASYDPPPPFAPPPSNIMPPASTDRTDPPTPAGGWVSLGQPGWLTSAGTEEGWEHLGTPLPPPRRRRRASLIAAAAVVALLGGGTATILAVSDSNSGFKGAASPREAVNSLLDDLNQADVIGVLDHLAPAERTALLAPLTESISQAKRLHVLNPSADPSGLTGVELSAKNIRYDNPPDQAINDHVRIVKLVGGTITVNADLSKVPFTDQFLKVVFPGGIVPKNTRSSSTVDLAAVAHEKGPVRIATQQVSGKWYPSLLYTIADDAVHENGLDNPTPSDYVAPKGASTPEDAVKQALVAISKREYRRLIELAAPDELQVVHDYGGIILANIPRDTSTSFSVKGIRLVSTRTSGAVRVVLKGITVDVPGHETTVTINGDCAEITVDGDYRKFCADQLVKQLNAGPFRNSPLTAEESAALQRLARGVANVSTDAVYSDGQWYIAALRSQLDGINALLEPLHDNDLIVLLHLMKR
jgi:hypothetical protein